MQGMNPIASFNGKAAPVARWITHAGLAVALGTAGALPAFAIDVTSPRIDLAPIAPRVLDRGIDLEALRNRQQRDDFRLRQDRYRQEDRDAASQRERDVRVPVVKPNCRNGGSGNGAITFCP